MTKLEEMPTDLTLSLDDLPSGEFVKAVRSFDGYVSEITKAQGDAGSGIRWTVRVRSGSALIGVEPNAAAHQAVLDNIYNTVENNLKAVKEGDIAAANLSEKAADCLKNLSEISQKYDPEKSVKIWVRQKPIVIASKIAKAIHNYMESNYRDFGTVEGRLETIKDSSGTLHIRIKDLLYPRSIKCVVPEEMLSNILQSFRCRVEVEGWIHYRHDGTPISIQVEAMETLPENHELPAFQAIRGIMANS